MAGPVGERLSVGVDVLLLMYRAEGRSSRNSFLQWVQNQIVKRVILLSYSRTRNTDSAMAPEGCYRVVCVANPSLPGLGCMTNRCEN